jgi:hypothetical protein
MIRIGLTREGEIVPLSARTHEENVWGVQRQGNRVVLGQSISPGCLIGRKNAINLAVWLLRAAGSNRQEFDAAMSQALSGQEWQGFRMLFGDDEP